MDDKNKWKIGCFTALTLVCFLLGLAFNECAPCQRVLYFFACVFLFILVIQIVVAVLSKPRDKKTYKSISQKENTSDETVEALLEKPDEDEKKVDEGKESKKRKILSLEEIQKLLDEEKDERLKPFFENYIKCDDVFSKREEFIKHGFDHEHPDSEESKLYDKEYEAYFKEVDKVRIHLGDASSETAEYYRKFSEVFGREDYDEKWIIHTTVSEYNGTSFKNAPTLDRDLLFKYNEAEGCNWVGTYCKIPVFDRGQGFFDSYYFYPDFIVLTQDDYTSPKSKLEIITYDGFKANYIRIKIKENLIWADEVHDAKRIGSWTDEYGEKRPIFEYGGVEIPALNCTLVFSKASYAKELAEAMNDFFSAPHGNGVTTSKRPTIDDLDGLIGLTTVKEEVKTLRNYILIQQEREKKGLKSTQVSYHCVFTGNPGTGKTTVARIVADVYRSLGVLKKGHLVETDRSGLVADYVGQTATKTNKIIDRALDGVLFIDEAYSLVGGGENDYGKEAIATLLKRMEDNRDRLVVILAGYSDEMKQFIDSNPGLQSRFNRYIHFPDYNADELYQIFEVNCQKNDYVLTDEAKETLKAMLEKAVAEKDKNFGNARFVRNLFEKTLERQANRLSKQSDLTKEMLTEIIASDLQES